MSWTQGRIEELVTLLESGLSRNAIALQLGVSRNAICGKIDRLKKAGILDSQPVRKPRRKPRKPGKRPTSSTVSAGRVVSPAGPAAKRRAPSAPPCEGAAVTLPSIAEQNENGPTISLAPDQGPTAGAIEGPSVSLVEARADQCRFPIWPHMAMPDHPDYGRACGAQVAPNKSGERRKSHCPHHQSVVNSKAETEKAKRIVKATVRRARAQGVA